MPLNYNNPFQPKKVDMPNYHPEQIEQNKLKQAQERTQIANGRIGEYSTKYRERRYSDVIPKPKSYGDVLPHQKAYGDVLNKNQNTVNNNTIFDKESDAERIKNVSRPHNDFYGN